MAKSPPASGVSERTGPPRLMVRTPGYGAPSPRANPATDPSVVLPSRTTRLSAVSWTAFGRMPASTGRVHPARSAFGSAFAATVVGGFAALAGGTFTFGAAATAFAGATSISSTAPDDRPTTTDFASGVNATAVTSSTPCSDSRYRPRTWRAAASMTSRCDRRVSGSVELIARSLPSCENAAGWWTGPNRSGRFTSRSAVRPLNSPSRRPSLVSRRRDPSAAHAET